MKLYLDDFREAPDGWERMLSVRSTIALLEGGNVTDLSLDHDLGNPEVVGTGYDVLLWLERKKWNHRDFQVPNIKIHTANPPARERMEAAVKRIEAIHD